MADPAITPPFQSIDDLCFIDTETRALPGLADPRHGDVRVAGAHTYSKNSKVIVVTYAIGDGPVQEWTLGGDLSGWLDWDDAPDDLRAFLFRAWNGDGWFVAFNAAFDRLVMNHGMKYAGRLEDGDATIEIPMMLDAMVQAAASGYPQALGRASAIVGGEQKDAAGKGLISLFTTAEGATPLSHPAEWAQFRSYARDDVAALRDLWKATRPLPLAEWEVYWANEAVNDRGLPIDRHFCERAAALAHVYETEAKAEVRRITGKDWGPKHHVALAGWAFDRLQHIPEAADIMVKSYDVDESNPDAPVVTVGKVSLDRERIEKLIPLLEARDADRGLTDDEFAVLELCEVKLYAAGSTVQKFNKLLPMLGPDDRLRGQYVTNGAAQTGRFSSRGVQTHNLTRAWVGMETKDTGAEERIIAAICALPEVPTAADLRRIEEEFGPVGRALARLIRPAICAEPGKVIIWGDESNIEARVLPWLTGEPGEAMLDIFRGVDADPTAPDVYMLEAAKTYRKPAAEVNKTERQIGKVQVLSLGFGGGWRALMNMAGNYRLSLSRDQAEPLVRQWRENNPWATNFWSETWRAAMLARNNPGSAYQSGRLWYLFDSGYRGGTLFCMLPSQRLLCYPELRMTEVEKMAEDGSTRVEDVLTYATGDGRRTLWAGILVENATQAVAADILRGAIVRMEQRHPGLLIGHTHDELIAEVDEAALDLAKAAMMRALTEPFDWACGLPVAAEVEHGYAYSKVEG